MYQGFGELIHPKGYTIFRGMFKDGKKHGKGKEFHEYGTPNGNPYYEGDYENGYKHGYGI
jgi:hypothetical protein